MKKRNYIFRNETSCDETAAAVIKTIMVLLTYYQRSFKPNKRT